MSSFKKIFANVLATGKFVSPRGQKTLEIENALCVFQPYERFMTFPSRKLSISYIRDELLWYLKGNPYDLSICEKASIWKDMITDGRLNSNYGSPIFYHKGIDYVVRCLTVDPSSRRACISILGKMHLYMENKDVPCTVSMGFRLRNNILSCSVHMRSTDLIFGMGNDIPFFSIVQEMVCEYLRNGLPDIKMGELTLFSESLHCYERHFEMLEKLVTEEVNEIECPRIQSANEIDYLRASDKVRATRYPFGAWLYYKDSRKEKQ